MSKARVEGGSVVVSSTWPELKSQIDNRNINFKYQETTTAYEIAAIDGPFFYVTLIYKAGEAPQDQSTYDTWRTEFETYYKNRITDFTSTQPYFLTNADGYSVVLKNGALPTANDGYGVGAIGYDGTNYRLLKTATDGALRIDPTGTTTQPVNGTVTANQGTANSLANAWPIKLTDGTNTQPTGDTVARSIFHQITDGTTGPVAVKAASTAPTVTDKALVVVLSPNQPSIPVSNAPATTTPAIAAGYVLTSSTSKTAVIASTYSEQTTNAQRSFKSSSANDTSAGTGARSVLLTYYDQTLAGPFTETITLNGTSAVNTTNTNICYIESMIIATAGSGNVNAGTITLYISTAGAGGTLATMNVGENRTFWGNHYVASNKTCYITGLSGHNTNSSNGSVLTLTSFNPASANQVESQISDFVRCGGGTSQPVRVYNQLIRVPGPARIRLYETCEGTATITTRAAFDYYDQ